MADLFDYIIWRGDLTFEQSPLNCVDALIFSQMAYLPFDDLWSEEENGEITLAEAEQRLKKRIQKGASPRFLLEKDKSLFPAMAQSGRYGQLKLRDYVNRIDAEEEKQFSAVTVLLPDGAFLVYRGTDSTLIGWNEDFNMTFHTPVPAQIDALEYFEKEAEAVSGTLWLGGHSKGGNLAMYAGMFCPDRLRNRIAGIYSNDGPGFDGSVVKKEDFQRLDGLLHSFVPQSSIVGMLLDHQEDFTVVRSCQVGFLQHDLYSWEVLGADFVRLNALTGSSVFMDKTIREWLAKLDVKRREEFVNALFGILGSANADSFQELRHDVLKRSGSVLKYVADLDHETRRMVLETLGLLVRSAQEQIPELLPKAPWQ